MSDTVLYDVTEGLATITLNRPDAMNALNTELKETLRDTLQQAGADDAVRAVLLTGNGRAFCVGQDLKEHVAAVEKTGGGALDTVEKHYNPITLAIAAMPKPVVAGINGVAAGAGAGFAFAADYRVAADTAAFNTSFAGVALSTDSGVAWTLPRLVGPGRATDLLYFPRSVKAPEALELGLANTVVPAAELAAEAESVARRLAEGPTVAFASMKQAMAYGTSHSLAETLEKESELQLRAGASADHKIAVDAFLQKQQPRFTGQ